MSPAARASLLLWGMFAVGLGTAFPSALSAQTLGPGCRLATEADKQALRDRGIPDSFQVCPQDERILGIGRTFDQWYAQLKSQGRCQSNNCTLSCRTRNTGAQVCGPTSRRWGSIGCHPNNQTAIFPTVSHGFAAHIELLRRYCGERGRCTITQVIQQWAEGGGSNYANFVSQHSGIPVNQVFNPNDIDLVGRMALAMSCYEAGALPYSVDELRRGLIMAAGGPQVAIPPNVGALLNESLTGAYSTNWNGSPNSGPGSWLYPQNTMTGSGYYPPTPPSSPLPVIPQSQLNQDPNLQQGTSTPTGTPSGNQSSASILVQPARVQHGGSVLVSWTSVNMRGTCTVAKNSAQFATGNEGARRDNATAAGTVTYMLSCTRPTGEVAQSLATVTIQ